MVTSWRGGCEACAPYATLFRYPNAIGEAGETFVTRKITRALAHIKLGLQEKLFMRNLDSRRDWGYAKEYVEAIWLMLQQPEPDDYVIATNETHTIRECLEVAFGRVGLDWQKYMEIDPRYYRPAEVELLIGDASKAKRKMGWEPKTKFKDLIELMVDADLASPRGGVGLTYLHKMCHSVIFAG